MPIPRIVERTNESITFVRLRDFRGESSFVDIHLDYPSLRRACREVGAHWTGNYYTRKSAINMSESEVQARFDKVSEFMTDSGDLKHEAPRPGCFTVPFWNAVGVGCEECPHIAECTDGALFRVTFGGDEDYTEARAYFAERSRQARLKSMPLPLLPKLLTVDQRLFRLFAVYAQFWWLSDKDARKLARERATQAQKAATAKRKADAKEQKAQDRQKWLRQLDLEYVAFTKEAILAGDFERIRESILHFIESATDKRRNRRKGEVIAISYYLLGWLCLKALETKNPDFAKRKDPAVMIDKQLEVISTGSEPEIVSALPDSIRTRTLPATQNARLQASGRRDNAIYELFKAGWRLPELSITPLISHVYLMRQAKPKMQKS